MNNDLILVDENDIAIGMMEKLKIHRLGLLHRAFSVFIFNTNGELLLQQRADTKYHSAGLWSNTCCSHPVYNEKTHNAVERRLQEERGLRCQTVYGFSFIYNVDFENGLKEHEYDHVYFGITDIVPTPDITEVKNWKHINTDKLKSDIQERPEIYSEWMKICLPEVIEKLYPSIFKTTYNKHYVSV